MINFSFIQKSILVFCFTFVVTAAYSQLLTPLSNEMTQRVEQKMSTLNPQFFTVSKPFFDNQLKGIARQDSLQLFGDFKKKRKGFGRKLLQESFLQIDSSDYYLFADPLYDFSYGKETPGENTYTNTRGFRAGGRLGDVFAFETKFYENQGHFTKYINNYIDSLRVVPGQGSIHNNKTYDYDFANTEGYLSYSPFQSLNIQFGQGKSFIGDGYRSLLLSDFAYNYPYFKTTFLSENFMYSWMINKVIEENKNDASNSYPYPSQTASIHLLSTNIFKRLQISFIQEELFYNYDTLAGFTPDLDIYNPIIMPKPSRKDLHSIWGENIKLRLFDNFYVYHQLLLDNLSGTGKLKKGLQFGGKYFIEFYESNLSIQGEYNRVDPNTYTGDTIQLNWKHYKENLAHPYGNNLEEYIGMGSFQWKRILLSAKIIYAQTYKNSYHEVDLEKTQFTYWHNGRYLLSQNYQITLLLNPKTLSGFTLGAIFRNERMLLNSTNSEYIYFSWHTSLNNRWFGL